MEKKLKNNEKKTFPQSTFIWLNMPSWITDFLKFKLTHFVRKQSFCKVSELAKIIHFSIICLKSLQKSNILIKTRKTNYFQPRSFLLDLQINLMQSENIKENSSYSLFCKNIFSRPWTFLKRNHDVYHFSKKASGIADYKNIPINLIN